MPEVPPTRLKCSRRWRLIQGNSCWRIWNAGCLGLVLFPSIPAPVFFLLGRSKPNWLIFLVWFEQGFSTSNCSWVVLNINFKQLKGMTFLRGHHPCWSMILMKVDELVKQTTVLHQLHSSPRRATAPAARSPRTRKKRLGEEEETHGIPCEDLVMSWFDWCICNHFDWACWISTWMCHWTSTDLQHLCWDPSSNEFEA